MPISLVNGKGDGITNAPVFRTALALGNVDNTSDINKPVSTATQAAINSVSVVGSDQLIPTPLNIVDDVGGFKITHTAPLFIPGGFAGYKYWLAYTPYPGADQENPRVMASNDGVNFVLPAGMSPLIDTLANAQTLGHIGWSDTDLAWDGSKLWLIYRGYGDGATYTTAETIYLRQCTDGINWSARTSLLVAPLSTSAKYLSPSILQMPDGTWRIYAIDNGAGGMQYYTSTNGTTGWAFGAKIFEPVGISYWHACVRLYNGVFYSVVNSRRTWGLYVYTSLDGLVFTGRGIPFVPRTDAAYETGGNYRSGFYLSGANPPVMNIYAIGMTGTTADANNANKTHRCYIYRKPYEGFNVPTSSWDWDTIQMTDNFVAGQDATTTDSVVGDLRWSLYNGVGVGGTASPGGANRSNTTDSAMPGLGCVAIKSGTTAGNISGIQFDHETATGGGRFPWNYVMLKTLEQPTFRVTFKIQSLADSIWIGFGSGDVAASPTRWTGLQLTPASANWRFVSREAGGSSVDVDSTKAAIAGVGKWWRFEMQWTGTVWRMRIMEVNAYQEGFDWVSVTPTINDASGINFGMWTMAGGAAAAELRVCKWAFRAFTGRY